MGKGYFLISWKVVSCNKSCQNICIPMGLSTCPLKFARKMMEEVNDEQPEIVTHEEVALAEREAMQTSTGKYTRKNCD